MVVTDGRAPWWPAWGSATWAVTGFVAARVKPSAKEERRMFMAVLVGAMSFKLFGFQFLLSFDKQNL